MTSREGVHRMTSRAEAHRRTSLEEVRQTTSLTPRPPMLDVVVAKGASAERDRSSPKMERTCPGSVCVSY